ncbi:kelch domain-containing protein 3-like [Uloborus diversus]|uniref:kelch domain-containing protein 3-like n=1 Tax=Uloborus diversus TaxID=327109 RepID=UPI00240A94BA|nr:kelch domain-containing protein 3-like [Uloborus diversus]XP_054706205.1 kelch domain-containing protein 3-like [Uloborus diversus]
MHWTVHLEGGPQRVNHAAVAVGSKIYSFGGYSSYDEVSGRIDVQALDTESYRWYTVYYQASKHVPFKRYGHSVVAYGRKVYLWGGRNDLNASNILHCYDTDNLTWSIPAVKGAIPFATDGHAACVIGHYMYLFGGFEEQTEKCSQSVHRLNLETFVWEEINVSGNIPTGRDFHTASAIGNKMYIFGGRSFFDEINPSALNEYYCNKIIRFNTESMLWEAPDVSGDIPCGRRSHSAVVYQDELYIFGGYNAGNNKHLNDLYKFNPETGEWTKLVAIGEGPCPRRRHCACVVGNQMFLFGGSSPSQEAGWESLLYEEDSQKLIDHSDLHVLDFFPSLKRLCQLKVIDWGLNTNHLPRLLTQEINLMIKDNIMTGVPNQCNFYPRRDYEMHAFSA